MGACVCGERAAYDLGKNIFEDEALEMLSGGCDIELVADRAITPSQLTHLENFILRRCSDGVVDLEGDLVSVDCITTRDLVTYMVVPATQDRGCSFVELVASGPQRLDWFVSHVWSQAALCLFECIQQHTQDRGQSTAPYWIFAFACAHPAGDLRQEVDCLEVLKLSGGTISVVDSGGVYFSRAWCCYEVWISLTDASAAGRLYDIYTTYRQGGVLKAVGVCDGPTVADTTENPTDWIECKLAREAFFHGAILQKALRLDIAQASASDEADRCEILNMVAREAHNKPSPSHKRYTELNAVLRGRYAASFWRHAVEQWIPMMPFSEALAGSRLMRLEILLQSCSALTDEAMGFLWQGLPGTLQELSVNFSECKVVNAGCSALASFPSSLRRLDLRMNDCETLCDDFFVSLASALPNRLKHLEVSLGGCYEVEDAPLLELACKLPLDLRRLVICLSGCNVTDKVVKSISTNLPQSLQYIDLDFGHCLAVTSSGAEALGPSFPSSARQLFLRLDEIDTLTDATLEMLAKGLPQRLQTLELNLRGCLELTDVGMEALTCGLPPDLEQLTLSASGCDQITDAGLKHLVVSMPPHIRSVTLYFEGTGMSPAAKQAAISTLELRSSLCTCSVY